MMNHPRRVLALLGLVLCMSALLTSPALAYGGPGSIISGIGTVLAVVAAVLASLFGFVWFPLKRLYQKMTGSPSDANDPTDE